MGRWFLAVLLVGVCGCASHAVWVSGAPVIEEYVATVRIYRAGPHCRLEVVLVTETIITLPTQCRTVPHMAPRKD